MLVVIMMMVMVAMEKVEMMTGLVMRHSGHER